MHERELHESAQALRGAKYCAVAAAVATLQRVAWALCRLCIEICRLEICCNEMGRSIHEIVTRGF
ncbi:hypothetical protein [Cupriavidus pauculus]|uniref:hypothetical protein n=1 Tax=Cupriavidus pauculus TaxID=82633 RepID=UPI001EE28FA1|nr:hypothetical protein [Cupriavidus pauculus]GJG93061.1 hypothetical protein CBA19C6_01250 [Cupriavidus pauculus]